MDKVVTTWGAEKQLLPAYHVIIRYLLCSELIQAGDLLLFGCNFNNFHDWTTINEGSSYIGKTCLEASLTHIVGRKVA